MEAGKHKVECPNTFVDVSVPMLLYGIHTSTDQQVMDDIQQGQKKVMNSLDEMKKEDLQMLDIILEKVNQQSELIWRNFTRQWNLEMKKLEAECPNTFILTPSDGSLFNFKNWMNEKYQLILICQHPPGPHRVGQGYRLKKAREWWIQVSPWLNYLIKFLRFGVPLGKVIGVVIDEVDVKQMQSYLDMMEQIINDLPELADLDSMKHLDKQLYSGQDSEVVGPALRGLYSFLKEVDPIQNWEGLHKTLTPDGNILWLCGNHHKQFEVKPLELKI
jgi:internalin A